MNEAEAANKFSNDLASLVDSARREGVTMSDILVTFETMKFTMYARAARLL